MSSRKTEHLSWPLIKYRRTPALNRKATPQDWSDYTNSTLSVSLEISTVTSETADDIPNYRMRVRERSVVSSSQGAEDNRLLVRDRERLNVIVLQDLP
jgi:hypothetical protein